MSLVSVLILNVVSKEPWRSRGKLLESNWKRKKIPYFRGFGCEWELVDGS
jgi:hypothetical protein